LLLFLTAFVLTHLPGDDLPNFQTSDTSLHTVGFFGLASWFVLSLAAFDVGCLKRLLIVAVGLALYAAMDERTQPYFGRACELRDWFNDMIGTGVALVLWEIVFAWVQRKTARLPR